MTTNDDITPVVDAEPEIVVVPTTAVKMPPKKHKAVVVAEPYYGENEAPPIENTTSESSVIVNGFAQSEDLPVAYEDDAPVISGETATAAPAKVNRAPKAAAKPATTAARTPAKKAAQNKSAATPRIAAPMIGRDMSNTRLGGQALGRGTPKPVRDRLKSLFNTSRKIKHVIEDKTRVASADDVFEAATMELQRAQTGYILTGTITGIERNAFGVCVVIFHKGYKVNIYADQFRLFPEFDPLMYSTKEDMQQKFMKKQIGAKVDFIIMSPAAGGGIDVENRVAIGDRLGAMRILRKDSWYPKNNQKPAIHAGSRIDARVTNVTTSLIIVEAAGAEFRIANGELTWGFLQNAASKFRVGQVIPVDIISATVNETVSGKTKAQSVTVVASHKTTQPDMQFEGVRHICIGGMYKGKITSTTALAASLFVELDDLGVTVKCAPPNGVFACPAIDDEVTVIIKTIQKEFAPPRVKGEIRQNLNGTSVY